MTRYADSSRCPDCHRLLPAAPSACPGCRLPLTGPLAVELHRTLTSADRLLEQLRELRPSSPDAAVLAGPRTQPRARRGLSAASVPSILLGLGALCLLVAAVTFLAVAWAWLGIGGRTVVLVALTVAAAGAGTWLARRGLVVAGESLTLVSLGLLALDVVGADDAGWLGDLGSSYLTAVVGAVVGAVALALSLVQRPRLVVSQVMAVVGATISGLGLLSTASALDAVLVGAVLVQAGLVAIGQARGLGALRTAALVGLGAWWLGLATSGAVRASADPSLRALWLGLEAWPVLTACLLAALGGRASRRHPWAGPALGATASLLLVVTMAIPAVDESVTHVALVAGAVVAVAAGSLLVVPRRWVAVPLAPMLAAALPAATILLALVLEAALAVLSVGPPYTQDLDVRLSGSDPVAHPGVLVPLVVVLWFASAMSVAAVRRGVGACVLTLGAVATACLYAVPLAVPSLGLLLVALALVAGGLPGRTTPTAGTGASRALAAAAVGLAALVASLPSAWLSFLVLAVVVAGAAVTLLVARLEGAGAALALATAGLLWTSGEVASLDHAHRAAPVLVALGALVIARPRLPTELGAALAAAVVTASAVPVAAEPATSLALHLTLAGVLVVVSSLVNPTRRLLAWPGGLLLAAASWVRLSDLGVSDPEAYTLPSAVVLVLVGLAHLSRHADTSSRFALAPGLLLATVPSLLVVLFRDPVSVRAALLGTGCLALVVLGTRLRWSAPLVVGASVGGLLVLRELAPYAAATPQWVMIGLAGTLLTLVGITWERRVRDLREAASYLLRLR